MNTRLPLILDEPKNRIRNCCRSAVVVHENEMLVKIQDEKLRIHQGEICQKLLVRVMGFNQLQQALG